MEARMAAPGGASANERGAAIADHRGAAIAAKAAQQAWSAEDIDWRAAPARPWWLPRRNHVVLASQFLHGEAVAQAACERLLPLLPEGGLRRALASQVADEARHVAVHERYMARLGDVAPPRPVLVGALAQLGAWQGPPEGLVLATHVVLESEALAIQQALVRDFPCPLLRRICALAARDESRHLAIGRLLLREAGLAARPLEERVLMHRALRRFWQEAARAIAADHGLFLARAATPARIEAGWERLERSFRRLGLTTPGEERAFAAA